MPSMEARRQALLDLITLFGELEGAAVAVVVEGPRDVEALRRLGFQGRVEVCSRVGVSDSDLVEDLARRSGGIVILTDFDEEGRRMNRRLSKLLERRGVRVEEGIRRAIGRVMAVLGVHAVEALDDVQEKLRMPGF